jgi:hypothetical protein
VDSNVIPNFAFPRFLSYQSAVALARYFYRSLFLLFFSGFLVGISAAADVSNWRPRSFGPSLSFSIGDFDGDQKPDLASLQTGRTDSSHTEYWIQVRLSGAEQQTILIVAPLGGLEVVSHDVNDDHAPDLVLTTSWLRRPVAILLNDGHGHFSRVAPEAFPEAFSESEASVSFTCEHPADAIGIPPQSREEVSLETEFFRHLGSQARFVECSNSRFGTNLFLISHPSRAPPFEVSHS